MLRIAASVIASRAELAQRANLTFGGQRNVSQALGYADLITPAMYRMRYERGDIASAIVEAYPKATWGAGGAAIFDDEDPENETKFEKDIKALFKKLQVWQCMQQLDILAGLGRYGVLLLGSAQDMEQERPENDKSPVLYLQPLSEELCPVERLEADKKSERYGQPLYYLAKTGTVTGLPVPAPLPSMTRRVHYSHTIHFVEGNLSDKVFGVPRLRSVWNRLDDLDKLVGGGAEAAWHRAHPGMNAQFDPEMVATMSPAEIAELKDKISEQYAEYEHKMRRLFQTVGVDMQEFGGGPFSFDASAKMIIAIIAAAKRIPQRKLLGSGIGEMTGKMEDDAFNDEVSVRRQEVAEMPLRQLVDHFISTGQVSEPQGGEYEIEWPEEEELDEGAKATVVSTIASANQALKNAGLEPVMLPVELRDRIYGLPPIPKEDLPKPPPAPAAATPGGAVGDGEGTAPPLPPSPAGTPVVAAASAVSAHVIADAYAPRLERAFRKAFDSVREQVDMDALERAVSEGNQVVAEQLLADAVMKFGDLLDEELPAQAATMFAEGGT